MPNTFIKILCTFLLGIISLSFIGCSSDTTSVDNLYIVDIKVVADHSFIPAGFEQQYTATAVFSDDTSSDISSNVSWSSSDTAIAKIDAMGLVTGIASGSVTITASTTFNSKSAQGTSELEVQLITLESIELTTSSGDYQLDLKVDEIEQLTATGVFSNNEKREITSEVTWETLTDNASVNNSGLVTGLAEGLAQIRAKYTSTDAEEVNRTISGMVGKAIPLSIDISGKQALRLGATTTLAALASYPNDAYLDISKSVTWATSDESLATVNEQGDVVALGLGEVTISATFEGVEGIYLLSVSSKVVDHLEIQEGFNASGNGKVITDSKIKLRQVLFVLYSPLSKNAYYPTVWAVFEDGSKEYINDDAYWASDNLENVFVDPSRGSYVFGKSLSLLSTKVTAYYGGESTSFKPYVVLPIPRTLAKITVEINGVDQSGKVVDINAGDKTWLTAYAEYENGDIEDINTKVVYSSSDSSKAYVLGLADTYLRARAAGESAITASFGGEEAVITVNVK
ncbi:MAG: Ig-like domain-containing protein [Pseudomonadales bacterium]|nr:Ig-like domain-containing protein [Pseudomonadales bacterium]